MAYKKFIVSKSDTEKAQILKDIITEINPNKIFILVESSRSHVYTDINATVLPLRELNKNSNWIEFTNTFNPLKSLLVVDNILKFMFFGDGSKTYIKDKVQSFNNVVLFDILPFYTEPSEIYYPFWFLGKGILGYNSYNAFKSNHLEETLDGNAYEAHSFKTLRSKINGYYLQMYRTFFKPRTYINWELTNDDILKYNSRKQHESENFTNPIKLYNSCSEAINLIETKFKLVNSLTKNMDSCCVVINAGGIYPKMYLKYMENKNVSFLTFHDNPSKFVAYKNIILAEMPIVKPHNWLYIESTLNDDQQIYQLNLTNNKLEKYFHDKIFNNELRIQLDSTFYSTDL